MRAPPESFNPMIGAPFWTARSISLQILSPTVSESDPPKTVKSCAKTYTVRPSTVPAPQTTPSPGIFVFSIPNSRQRCSTKGSSSKKEPGSSSRSIRSWAESLPSRCCRSILSGPPPSRAFSRSSSSLAIFFSRVIVGRESEIENRKSVGDPSSFRFPISDSRSQDDPALLGELAADAAEELLAVHPAGGDLVSRGLHHPPRLLVQRALLFRLVRERREDRLAQHVVGPLVEELPRGDSPGRPHRDEFLLRIRQAHGWADVNTGT